MDQFVNLAIAFAPIVAAFALGVFIEHVWPAVPNKPRTDRFLNGTVLYLLGIIPTILLVPVGVYGVVAFTDLNQFGLLRQIAIPSWLALIAGVIIYDFAEWASHALMHKIPLLWRFHRIHHTDGHLDVATGLRFHPVETVFRYLFALGTVLVMGLDAVAVAVYSVIAVAFNLWEHSNIVVPRVVRPLHHVLITPELHRVHHSTRPEHFNCNYGLFLSIWDRLAGTRHVARGDERLNYGLSPADMPAAPDTLHGLLVEPFTRSTGTREVPAKGDELPNP